MASSKQKKGRRQSRRVPPRSSGSRASSSGSAPKRSASSGTSSVLPPFIPEKIERQLLETITSSVNDVLAPEKLAEAALQVFLEMTEAQGAAIYLQDEQTAALRCVAVHGAVGGLSPEERERIIGQVMRNGGQARTASPVR